MGGWCVLVSYSAAVLLRLAAAVQLCELATYSAVCGSSWRWLFLHGFVRDIQAQHVEGSGSPHQTT